MRCGGTVRSHFVITCGFADGKELWWEEVMVGVVVWGGGGRHSMEWKGALAEA